MFKEKIHQKGGGVMMLLAFFMLTSLCSCDEHEPVDKDIHPGYILCADGSILSESAYYSQSRTKACGVVFTDMTKAGHYLAVSVFGGGNGQFCDSLGVSLGTSCSLTALDGFSNTTTMQNQLVSMNKKLESSGWSACNSIALTSFDSHPYGQSEYIPSVEEMRQLYMNIPMVNGVLSRLAAHGDHVSLIDTDDGGSGSCWYWTSTEVSENQGRQAWLFSMNSGGYIATPIDERHAYLHFVAIYY